MFLIPLGSWALYWLMFPPSPGYAMGLLAVVAIFMAVKDMSKPEKAFWLVIATVLFLAELKSIRRDRAEYEELAHYARFQEGLNFKAILTQNQRDFDNALGKMGDLAILSRKAVKLSYETVKQITGAGQYCYLVDVYHGEKSVSIAVVNSGSVPLELCRVVVYEADGPWRVKSAPVSSPITSSRDVFQPTKPIADAELGPLQPSKGILEGATTPLELPYGSYLIRIYTRNDQFTEMLDLKEHGRAFNLEVRDANGRTVHFGSPKLP